MLWTMPLAFPLMAAVQSMCAQIGRVTGKGLAANIKLHYSPFILYGVVFLLLMANTLNIAADIAAMAEDLRAGPGLESPYSDGVVCTADGVIADIHSLSPLCLFSQVADAVIAGLRSGPVHCACALVASCSAYRVAACSALDAGTATVVVGVFGTTISPYLFFWQASEEVEDMLAKPAASSLRDQPNLHEGTTPHQMGYVERHVLFRHNRLFHHPGYRSHASCRRHHQIQTAAQAANALRPLAGDFTFILFALGILGVGLIGVPVLAGSAAYAVSEAMGWKWGLERKATDARGFYGVIAGSVLGDRAGIFPIKPHEGFVLERGNQWSGGSALDDYPGFDGFQPQGHGRFRRKPEFARAGLDCDRGHGFRRCHDVCSILATWVNKPSVLAP